MTANSTVGEPSFEQVYLIGIRMWAEEESRVLYTLLLMDEDGGGKDRPLTDSEGYIVWFADPALAGDAFSYGDDAFRRHEKTFDEGPFVYDYARLFWRITMCDEDEGAVILDGVNLLLDLVKATGFPLPEMYRVRLWHLADGLTFSKDLAGLLREGVATRDDLMEALSWCVGAVTIKSRLVSSAA